MIDSAPAAWLEIGGALASFTLLIGYEAWLLLLRGYLERVVGKLVRCAGEGTTEGTLGFFCLWLSNGRLCGAGLGRSFIERCIRIRTD